MRKIGCVLLLFVLLLTGCMERPQSREVGSLAVVSVLGIDRTDTLFMTAATEGREGSPPLLFQGEGDTPRACIDDLTRSGERVVSCAHVEHWLLLEGAVSALPELLTYALRDGQQSTETKLWLVAEENLAAVFSEQHDTAQRMTVIKTMGEDDVSPLTLRESAARLAEGEALGIPVLTMGEDGLYVAGTAWYRDGTLQTWQIGTAGGKRG